MTKIILGIFIVIIIASAAYAVLFQSQSEELPPIVDPTCEPGYELVGEGCIPAKEACELAGGEYYYDESQGECRTR